MPKTIRAIAAPITARSTRCCASPPMVAPTSSTINSPRSVGHIAAIAGPLDRRHRMQAELGHRHQGAGVAGGDRAIGGAGLHRFDRLPHRRDAPPGAQGLARLVAHLDRDIGVNDARLGRELRVTLENLPDRLLLAVEEELEVRPALERDRRGRDDDARPVVAAHRVQRYANVARHSLDPTAPKRVARAAPGVGRDNSGFVAQGNARARPSTGPAGGEPAARPRPRAPPLAPSPSGRGPG